MEEVTRHGRPAKASAAALTGTSGTGGYSSRGGLFPFAVILSAVVIGLALWGSHRWPEHRTGLAISAATGVVLIAVVLMLPWMMRGY
jgi:hypothetical protein